MDRKNMRPWLTVSKFSERPTLPQAVPLYLSWQGVRNALWPLPFTKKEEAGSSLTTGRQEVTCFYPNIQIPGCAWGRPLQHVPHFPLFTLGLAVHFFFFPTKQSLFLSREDLPLRVISDREEQQSGEAGSFHTILECCCPPPALEAVGVRAGRDRSVLAPCPLLTSLSVESGKTEEASLRMTYLSTH